MIRVDFNFYSQKTNAFTFFQTFNLGSGFIFAKFHKDRDLEFICSVFDKMINIFDPKLNRGKYLEKELFYLDL